MGVKSLLAKPVVHLMAKSVNKSRVNPLDCQKKVFESLVKEAGNTNFGIEHDFRSIKNYEDFKKNVPIREYEDFKQYIEKIKKGDSDVLWPGKPSYFAKTSGTTSGAKYIPITKDSIPNHINTARASLIMYINRTGNSSFLDGKMMFLSGSPEMESVSGIKTGRLSGIVHNHVPSYLLANRLPSYETNCIEEWEEKMEKTADETLGADMRLISGIPPWIISYFEVLMRRSGKKIIELFPHFSVLAHGGVNYDPYKDALEELIGKKIDTLETYPASEGFIAFQDAEDELGLLLNVNSGIFFEFIPLDQIHDENPERFQLEDVKTDVNYAIVINNNAGLWGYSLGDTVKFLSTKPYRIKVTGRVKHYISAFGEHVIADEVEWAMGQMTAEKKAAVNEFTVAPRMNQSDEKPCHEWYVEFSQMPDDKEGFVKRLDEKMREKNIYYDDLIRSGILSPLKVFALPENSFREYMKSIGKLGGQNKIQRLSNSREITEQLDKFVTEKWEIKP
ncbi:MAG: hypothetical protein EA412_10525 [Chitinophagaceae bacterium]|nr:MAG: hypothetical protein EA412_10525 [Chitinophagaceae bacterium]